MKPKTLLLSLAIVLVLSIFVINAVSVVSAKPVPPPANGTWIASEESATKGLIPQFKLEAPTTGYALLQSDGVKVSGYTRICHPYRGGQFGWISEIRMLTVAGWVGVPTENGWEPDEEGQYLTCANVGKGTYAVFGHRGKPPWWPPIKPTPRVRRTPPPFLTLTVPPTLTSTPTSIPTWVNTPTFTPTFTLTNTPTFTPTFTPTNTPINTPTFTPTFTPTYTQTPINTPTFTPTFTPTNTPTNTPTFTPTFTPTNTPTNTPTFTQTPLPGPTLTHTPTGT